MKVKSHRLSPNVEFIAEGISGKEETTDKGWVFKTLETFLKEHGDKGLSCR